MFTSTAFKNPDTANQQFITYVQLLGSEQGWPSSAVQALLILSQQELEAAKAWWRSEQEEADLYWRAISQKALPTLDAVIDTSELPKIESFASLVGAAQTTAQAELERITLVVDEVTTKKEKIEATIELRKAKARLQAVA